MFADRESIKASFFRLILFVAEESYESACYRVNMFLISPENGFRLT